MREIKREPLLIQCSHISVNLAGAFPFDCQSTLGCVRVCTHARTDIPSECDEPGLTMHTQFALARLNPTLIFQGQLRWKELRPPHKRSVALDSE